MKNLCAEMTGPSSFGMIDDAVRAALTTVPGLSVPRHRACASVSPDHTGAPHGEVIATGWSPTLHAIQILMGGVMSATTLHPETTIEEMLGHLKRPLAMQRQRAARAASLGHHAPLDPTALHVPGHVHVDRGLARILGELLESTLHDALVHMHSGFTAHSGTGPHITTGAMCGEMMAPDGFGVISFAAPRAQIGPKSEIGLPVTFDGVQLRIHSTIPDTALTALRGRRVRDLTPLHPEIDDREIIAVSQGVGTVGVGEIVLTIMPDPVSLDEIRTW
jgi:hypothetical protein